MRRGRQFFLPELPMGFAAGDPDFWIPKVEVEQKHGDDAHRKRFADYT
jgi:hypothetical protein